MGWFVLPYVTLHLFLLLVHFPLYTLSLCNHHDNFALLQFKNSLVPHTSLQYGCPNSPKTESWKKDTDCCEWDGVTCDILSGHVIGLDLGCSNMKGVINPNSTIFQLRQLQQLNLALNDFSGSSIPYGIGDLVSLTHLNLSGSRISGDIPSSISHLSKLVSLDLSCSFDYNVRFDPFTWKTLILNATNLMELHLHWVDMSSIRENSLLLLLNLSSSLASLSLKQTGLQGYMPSDILSLPNLQELDLSGNEDLRGQLPKSNWSTPLRYLDLSDTAFSGDIPNSIGHLMSLNHLRLMACNFDGLVPPSLWNLTQLTHLGLEDNNLNGEIPSLISNLRHLTFCNLRFNNFSGQVPSSMFNLTQLSHLYLSYNKLVGPIPIETSKYSKLDTLALDHNMLNETIPHWCYSLPSLSYLNLNDNQLTGSIGEFSTYSLIGLILSNNKLQGNFPKFSALQNLQVLDLSNNKIQGKIPQWFYERLLHSWEDIYHVDLSFNKLQGDLPIPPTDISYFLVSNNNFTGDISSTLCNASFLLILNLSHNNLTGTIPQCLGTFPFLSVLDLQMNNFYGSMPRSFSKGNTFETIKLNGNRLEGPLPQSLANCTSLEVLDLGNNNIEDTFPTWLQTLQELQVLSLRSNKLQGAITCSTIKHPFPKLRIFDVSTNNFSGPLPTSCIKNFQGMVNVSDSQIGLQYMGQPSYYNDSVVVVMKGQSVELTRILTTFTTIDLSKNMFEGEIPQVIGELISLKGLNLSHNGITGTIPKSLSNLRNLEWLDLSWNRLTGEVPVALTNLNFLSFLNLSQNHLEGIIPTGQQFNTFENNSYEGNPMLCGFPLSKSCNKGEEQPPHSTIHHEEESGFGWKSVAVGYACGAVFGMLLGYNVFWNGKPQWLARLVERMFNTRLRRTNNRARGRANRRGMN